MSTAALNYEYEHPDAWTATRAAAGIATRVPVTVTVADLLGDGARFAVQPDGAVLAAFGPAPRLFGLPTEEPPARVHLAPLTGAAVRDHLTRHGDLLGQLGYPPRELNLDAVAELLADRARAHAARMDQHAVRQVEHDRELTAEDLARTERRAALLRELADVDREAATPAEATESTRGWRGFRR